jgi:hypothetical protein
MVALLTVMTGIGFTVTRTEFVPVQPADDVPAKVYAVLLIGVGFIVFKLLPLLHVYVFAPLATIVAVPPLQIVEEIILRVGVGFTKT